MAGQRQLHSLQYSWFTGGDAAGGDVEAKFRSIVGVEAEQFQRLKPPAAPVPLVLASSTTDDASVRLQIAPGRVDINIDPLSQEPTAVAPIFPDFQASLSRYTSMASGACGRFGDAYRQSMIARVGSKFDSMEEAAVQFAVVLGSAVDFRHATDLSFQINRRTERDGIAINRVLRWFAEVREARQVIVTYNPGSGAVPSEEVLGEEVYLSYLTDINTVPDPKVAHGKDGQERILKSLFDVTQEALKYETVGEFT